MTLTGLGQGNVMAGVDTSLYAGTINGTPTTIICDDFADDSFMNESWQANVIRCWEPRGPGIRVTAAEI